MSVTIEENPLSEFMYALRAPDTKRQYPRRLKVVFDYIGLEGSLEEQAREFLTMAKSTPLWAQKTIIEFIVFQKKRAEKGEISPSTINNYYKPVKLFIEMCCDTPIVNWKKVARGLPKRRRAANDRAPTLEEIRKLSEYPDRRIKPILSIMVSSGIRLGAWDMLQWKHIEPNLDVDGKVTAAKLTVYPGDDEEYYTFITPEAYNYTKEWMDYRQQNGEFITGESWVMRDIWRTTEMNYGAHFGRAKTPKQLKSSGIKSIMERALKAQGLWKPLASGSKRREWKTIHGFRKYYKTRAEQVMLPIHVEITMGHDTGVSESYYRPTEADVLKDYLKAVDKLTISPVSELKNQINGLQSEIKERSMAEKSILAQIAEIRKEVAGIRSSAA